MGLVICAKPGMGLSERCSMETPRLERKHNSHYVYVKAGLAEAET